MQRAMRAVTLQRGYNPRHFTLVAFGGAGPLHAADLADALGVQEVLVPPNPGVLAAVGLTLPDLRRDSYQTVLRPFTEDGKVWLDGIFGTLEDQLSRQLAAEDTGGFGSPRLQRLIDVRYTGQSFELRVPYVDPAQSLVAFFTMHKERYGYASDKHPVELVHVRVQATLPRLSSPRVEPSWPEPSRPASRRDVWFGPPTQVHAVHQVEANIVWRPTLPRGSAISGPAVLEQYDTTTLVPPGWTAQVDERFNLILTRYTSANGTLQTFDP
jgi:N-methylhydantoinase A